jgi:hypothetical protein
VLTRVVLGRSAVPRVRREELLLDLAASLTTGTPPAPEAVDVLAAAWASPCLAEHQAHERWRAFLDAYRLRDAWQAAEPETEDLDGARLEAAATATLDSLLDCPAARYCREPQ